MKLKLHKALIGVAAAVGAISICAIITYRYFSISSDSTATLHIYPDSDVATVTDSLSNLCGNRFAARTSTLLNIFFRNNSVRTGAFRISPEDSPITLCRKIKNGMQSPVNFTFNNVRTLGELATKVQKTLMMSAEDFTAAATDSAFMASNGVNKETVTTLFIPDTYNCYWTISPEQLLGKLTDAHKHAWDSTRIAKAQNLGFTPTQVSILASIVEEETNSAAERPIVARLYLNRLRIGMPLQADPTVKFALGDFGRRRILGADLKYDSPYNTYRYAGLPPGAIRIPELRTIDAVLNAPAHKYLYMCAKEDFSGTHNFASTIAEHNTNAARYRAALNRRGISR